MGLTAKEGRTPRKGLLKQEGFRQQGSPSRRELLRERPVAQEKDPHNKREAETEERQERETGETFLLFGEIPKWPTGADCKSADYVFVGSNPALPTGLENDNILRK